MLTRYADWKKPTDAEFAFRLLPSAAFAQTIPSVGTRSDIRDVARIVLGAEAADRFERRVRRWGGPENVLASDRPYEGEQLHFEELATRPNLTMSDLDTVLRGTALVLRRGGQVDFILRDHHMIDVALYHYRTTGELAHSLFHADRHSDYCTDAFLDRRRPDQAATWWKLFEGLKRADDGAPVLPEERVFFATAKASHCAWMSGRDIDTPVVTPWFLAPAECTWSATLEREEALAADWVSLDLDYFQPSPQLALSCGLLRDARLGELMRRARVRVFVLSPQFTNGGDRFESWTVHGRMHSTLRLLNLMRR